MVVPTTKHLSRITLWFVNTRAHRHAENNTSFPLAAGDTAKCVGRNFRIEMHDFQENAKHQPPPPTALSRGPTCIKGNQASVQNRRATDHHIAIQ